MTALNRMDIVAGILQQLDVLKTRAHPPLIVNIENEVTLADYFFSRSWPKSISNEARTDNFKSSAMIWLIKNYRISSLLDANIGRGNRLITCATSGVQYIGIYDYLPTKAVVSRVLRSFKPDEGLITTIYGNFDNVLIGEYGVDAIFLNLTDANDRQVSNWIIKAWNNLDQGKILFMYSDKFDSRLRLLVSQVAEVLLGIDQASEKLLDLGTNESKVRVWRKAKPNNPNPYEPIVLNRDLYKFGATSLLRRAMRSYVRSLGDEIGIHYVCNSFVADTVVLDLAEELPSGRLTAYVNDASRFSWIVGRLDDLNRGVSVLIYPGDSSAVREGVAETLTPREVLLPEMLDSTIFEACLVQALRVSLPQDSGQLIAPERIWLETDYSVLIRALLQVWKDTTLLISCNGSVDRARRDVPLVLRGRTIFHKKESERGTQVSRAGVRGADVRAMRTKLGYETDSLLLA